MKTRKPSTRPRPGAPPSRGARRPGAAAVKGDGASAVSIAELERMTGVRRHVIYFYVSKGLLPPPQKVNATRAIYTHDHARLLSTIHALKARGLALDEIGATLEGRIRSIRAKQVDLVATRDEQRREAILNEAARRFAQHGYDGTRISDIVSALRITPQVLYSCFPSKHHLFVACFGVFTRWMEDAIEPKAAAESDPAARLVWRIHGAFGLRALGPEISSLARAELMHEAGDLRARIKQAFEELLEPTTRDFARLAARASRTDGRADLFDPELLSYALYGALETMLMRSAWDRKYTRVHVMRQMLALFLTVEAAYEGSLDVRERYARLSSLVDHVSGLTPPGLPD